MDYITSASATLGLNATALAPYMIRTAYRRAPLMIRLPHVALVDAAVRIPLRAKPLHLTRRVSLALALAFHRSAPSPCLIWKCAQLEPQKSSSLLSVIRQAIGLDVGCLPAEVGRV